MVPEDEWRNFIALCACPTVLLSRTDDLPIHARGDSIKFEALVIDDLLISRDTEVECYRRYKSDRFCSYRHLSKNYAPALLCRIAPPC